ncbi:EthD domain-containing protein [Rhodococcus sp. SGAir0479]|uniref:EthD domain-containing protein n=1 Tax=Rhodococcus sp. SGAir0479 TaxID=2567884 RepID=UPI0010CD4427|nr:EthD domain-containing protein [Rhodococcus sp. SGAir0479]QCQ90947.1 EthD family reductase [Rhodococcus sp. SGAir0479]
MIKAVALLARRPDLTHHQFVEYYENNHAKLIRSLLPQIVEYRRNYLDRGTAIGADGATDPDFDVVSEFVFADRAGYDAMLTTHARPEVAAAIEADEKNFLDRSRTRMYVVDVRES